MWVLVKQSEPTASHSSCFSRNFDIMPSFFEGENFGSLMSEEENLCKSTILNTFFTLVNSLYLTTRNMKKSMFPIFNKF